MNVIVSNKNQSLLSNLDIDIIKSINGEFTADEIAGTFSNFFFNRMFLDITALKNYMSIENLQKLSMSIEMDKVIFLLDNALINNKRYLSKLVSLGIYNFATNKEDLMYLYNHPNSYKDVASYQLLDDSSSSDTKEEKKGSFFKRDSSEEEKTETRLSRVVGFKNATNGAGATTLIYMLKKILSEKKYTVAIELNKNDFGFFNEKDMYSVNQNNFLAALNKFGNADLILVDLNGNPGTECDEVVYLMEPSTIKLNKMMLITKDIFAKIKEKPLVLNKSLLNDNDVSDFESESNSRVTFNVPPLNDRLDNREVLEDLIAKLEL